MRQNGARFVIFGFLGKIVLSTAFKWNQSQMASGGGPFGSVQSRVSGGGGAVEACGTNGHPDTFGFVRAPLG